MNVFRDIFSEFENSEDTDQAQHAHINVVQCLKIKQRFDFTKGLTSLSIKTEDLPAGQYWLTVQNRNGQVNTRPFTVK